MKWSNASLAAPAFAGATSVRFISGISGPFYTCFVKKLHALSFANNLAWKCHFSFMHIVMPF